MYLRSVVSWNGGLALKVQVLKSKENDPDPDAIACYGFYRYDTRKITVRFVEGRPVADITIQFLEWLCGAVAKEGKKVLVVLVDNAGGHIAKDLKVPDNVRLYRLPPCTPELQPAEHLWPLVREALANRDFDHLVRLAGKLRHRCNWARRCSMPGAVSW